MLSYAGRKSVGQTKQSASQIMPVYLCKLDWQVQPIYELVDLKKQTFLASNSTKCYSWVQLSVMMKRASHFLDTTTEKQVLVMTFLIFRYPELWFIATRADTYIKHFIQTCIRPYIFYPKLAISSSEIVLHTSPYLTIICVCYAI